MPTGVSQNPLVDGALNASELLRLMYAGVDEVLYRHGDPVFRRIRPGDTIYSSGNEVDEGGKVYQMTTGFADSVRSSFQGDSDFSLPRKSRHDKIRVRFNPYDSTINDINRFEATGRLHITDLERSANNPGVARDVVGRIAKENIDGMRDAAETLMHSATGASIGSVNGTKKNNDNTVFASATTYTSGSTSARIKVDEFSIGIFKTNLHLDFYTSAGVLAADEVRVTDVNYEDFSVGLALTDRSTVANCNSLADNDLIYRSQERNQGFKCGFGELFKTSYANDNWIGGTDRNAEDKRHFQPIRTRTTSTSTSRMSSRIMNQLVRAVSHLKGMDRPDVNWALVMGMEAADNWAEDVDNAATAAKPASGGRLSTGVESLQYIHPAIGKIDILSTRTARNDRAILFQPGNFQIIYGDFKGLKTLTNEIGMFERVPGTGVNGGGSTYYRTESLMYMAPFTHMLNTMACAFNIE